jgi:hypothetical protein
MYALLRRENSNYKNIRQHNFCYKDHLQKFNYLDIAKAVSEIYKEVTMNSTGALQL